MTIVKRLVLLGVLGWLFWTGRSYSVADEWLFREKSSELREVLERYKASAEEHSELELYLLLAVRVKEK